MTLPEGTQVRLSKTLKDDLHAAGRSEHVRAYGRLTGVVKCLTYYSAMRDGPEVGVLWPEDHLVYAYEPATLEVVP